MNLEGWLPTISSCPAVGCFQPNPAQPLVAGTIEPSTVKSKIDLQVLAQTNVRGSFACVQNKSAAIVTTTTTALLAMTDTESFNKEYVETYGFKWVLIKSSMSFQVGPAPVTDCSCPALVVFVVA